MSGLLWPRNLNSPPPDHHLFLFSHGSGAPMDSPFMERITEMLFEQGICAVRFEFPYMAERRTSGAKRPPPAAEKLLPDFLEKITLLKNVSKRPLFIGGKSMGGRVAAMIGCAPPKAVRGVICFGYPLHPPGAPEDLRSLPLEKAVTPTLVCQGERDPFGKRDDFARFIPSDRVTVEWMESGDHDFVPLQSAMTTHQRNILRAAQLAAEFCRRHQVEEAHA